jgi:hypothetical protein
MSRTTLIVACTLVASLAVFAGTAAAQTPGIPATPGVYSVDYFANANTNGAPDAATRIINPGQSGGNLCADIFVFDPDEEISECCSCLTTPDGLLTLSVNSDLTSNPLTGVVLTTGIIKIVSAATTAGSCPLPTKGTPVPTLRSWTTHVQNGSSGVTETGDQSVPLSASEGAALLAQCTDISRAGSGHGICANSGALSSICNN